MDGKIIGFLFCSKQDESIKQATTEINKSFFMSLFLKEPANGLRYLRWGGDGEAVQPEK